MAQTDNPYCNNVTGERLVSKVPSDVYKENWDRIFGNSDANEANVDDPSAPTTGPADENKEVDIHRITGWLG